MCIILAFFFPADAYNHTDCELLKSENSHTRDPDSTASTAILVGDSRAVIYRSGNGNVIEICDIS